MDLRMFIGGSILIGLGSTAAVAQNTLGELLDAGGKKLSKEEVATTFSGAQVTGITSGGGQQELAYKADGSISGNMVTAQGKSVGIVGTWKVDDRGRLCTESTQSGMRGTLRAGQGESCNFYFVNLEQHYAASSDSDRASPILKRTIKK
jgi:hypothetical protein